MTVSILTSPTSGLRQLRQGGLMFIGIVLVATLGYEMAGWTAFDAFYMVIIALHRADGTLLESPDHALVCEPGDHVVAMTQPSPCRRIFSNRPSRPAGSTAESRLRERGGDG